MNIKEIKPDSTITIDERNAYGYTWDKMLPLRPEAAHKLSLLNLPVFKLYQDNSEALVTLEKIPEKFEDSTFATNKEKGLLYGIEISDWHKYLEGFTKDIILTCTGQDGLKTIDLNIILKTKPDMSNEDVFKAIEAASLEYCLTEQGKKTYIGNCCCFNYGDFDIHVTNDICVRHGIIRIDHQYHVIKDYLDTTLVFENDVLPEE